MRPDNGPIQPSQPSEHGSHGVNSCWVALACALLRGMPGFTRMTGDNKRFQPPYVACRNEAGDRWVIMAWQRCTHSGGNEHVPCMHADPQFPDYGPGQTHRLQGWLSFYEGTDIETEFKRIEKIDWRQTAESEQ